eukprot:4375653-Prymnesium_polylepis.1
MHYAPLPDDELCSRYNLSLHNTILYYAYRVREKTQAIPNVTDNFEQYERALLAECMSNADKRFYETLSIQTASDPHTKLLRLAWL